MHVCELLFIEVNVCFIHEHLFKYSDGHSTVCRGSVSSTRGTSIRLLKEVAIHGAPWLITPWCSNSAAFAVGIPKRGRSRTVSYLALIGFRPPFGSLHQYGIRPQRNGSSDTSL